MQGRIHTCLMVIFFSALTLLQSCVSNRSFQAVDSCHENCTLQKRKYAKMDTNNEDRHAAAFLSAVSMDSRPKPNPHSVVKEIKVLKSNEFYHGSEWALKVMDLDSGELISEFGGNSRFLIGSVRKLFSVGALLSTVGADYRFRTPVFRTGTLDQGGRLKGDVILVASGDLTMGSRLRPDGTLDIPDIDHNDANALGNAKLAHEDPLAGFDFLARQVKESGIKEIAGDVIIDDRLFQPFNFRNEFDVSPIFVNDDVVDISIIAKDPHKNPQVSWRPLSEAFRVDPTLLTVKKSGVFSIDLAPPFPQCFARTNCTGLVLGTLPIDFQPSPPFNFSPIVRTFRITDPAAYARTVFIEALERQGIIVLAKMVGMNPAEKLPRNGLYDPSEKIAELISPPFAEYAKYILKVSYNIGADTSLVLFGQKHGVDSLKKSLIVEKEFLKNRLKIAEASFHFVDGSGGGDTSATTDAILAFLFAMSRANEFLAFKESLPLLGIDGSLALMKGFTKDKRLKGALGNVAAKTGTYIVVGDNEALLKAEAFAGYITAKSGRKLAYAALVNNVKSTPQTILEDTIRVAEDLGKISAAIWADN